MTVDSDGVEGRVRDVRLPMKFHTEHLRSRCGQLAGQGGLTVVELLVTLALAGILSSGLFYMMAGQQLTYSMQVRNTTTQENLWGAMEFLQRQIRFAGYGFGACPAGRVLMDNGAGVAIESPLVPFRVYNDCNIFATNGASTTGCPDGSTADSFTVTYANPATVPAVSARMVQFHAAVHRSAACKSRSWFRR